MSRSAGGRAARSRAAAIALAAVVSSISSPVAASSYSSADGGTRVLYELLVDLGYRVDRRFGAEAAIGSEADGALLVGPLPAEGARRMMRWIRRGHLLVLAPSRSDAEQLCPAVRLAELRVERRLVDGDSAPSASGRPRPRLRLRQGRCRLTPPAGVRIVARAAGRTLAYEQRVGRGRVLVLASGGLLANRRLGRDDIAVVLRRWLSSRAPEGARLAFIEPRRGGQLWRALRRANLLPLALHGLLLLLVVYWKLGPRFGEDDDFEPRSGRAFSLHAHALGALYERAGASGFALRQLYRRALEHARRTAGYGGRMDSGPAVGRSEAPGQTRRTRASAEVARLRAQIDRLPEAGQRLSPARQREHLQLARELRRWSRRPSAAARATVVDERGKRG